MSHKVRLTENKIREIISEVMNKLLYESEDDEEYEEFVTVNDFVYKGVNLTCVGDGDSFCYCPCDIYGTPKMYYSDCHRNCADEAAEDILNSFGGNLGISDDENLWQDIVSDLWIGSCGRGRVFFDKYIVVGDNGHIPNKEYIDGVISYLGGTYDDYVVLYNKPTGGVGEISCRDAFKVGRNDRPNKMSVPDYLIKMYDELNGRRDSINKRFPTNMTRAQYYSLIRQENKRRKGYLL